MTRANTLTEIWKTYSDKVVNENAPAAPAAKFGTKPGEKPVEAKSIKHGFANDSTSGPANAEGVKEVIDPKKSKKSKKKDELYNSEDYSSQVFDKKIEKKVKESINNYMKSTFDKLFENVLGENMDSEQQELEALGVDVDNDGDIDVEASEEVTVTLGADHVKALKEILAQIEPEEGDDDEAEDMEHEDGEMYEMEEAEEDGEAEDEDEEDDDDEETHKEAVDAEDHGHPLVNQKDSGLTSTKNNKVALKGSRKKADSKIKKQDDSGSELSDSGGHSLTSTKNNKVGSLKVNADLFGD
jgi:hypothetical protein